MKAKRQAKIIELIKKHDVETQEELSGLLEREGFSATQATVSRDIRELKLIKAAAGGGKLKYVELTDSGEKRTEKYTRVFRDCVVSMDVAQNILVIRTAAGMAMAAAAALDDMDMREVVGCIAGDDTVMCAIRSAEDAIAVMGRLREIIGDPRRQDPRGDKSAK